MRFKMQLLGRHWVCVVTSNIHREILYPWWVSQHTPFGPVFDIYCVYRSLMWLIPQSDFDVFATFRILVKSFKCWTKAVFSDFTGNNVKMPEKMFLKSCLLKYTLHSEKLTHQFNKSNYYHNQDLEQFLKIPSCPFATQPSLIPRNPLICFVRRVKFNH